VSNIRLYIMALIVGWLISPVAMAQLTIEITRGVDAAQPIAVVPFAESESLADEEDIAAIIRTNLRLSGRFRPLSLTALPAQPANLQGVDYARWRAVRADYLVVGQISPQGDRYAVRFQLADVLRTQPLLGMSYIVQRRDFRRLAHQISDQIYQELTGERGAFSTRIAYIASERSDSGATYTLSIADADGYAPRVILRSAQPLMSPSWSPEGNHLAYVSFEQRRAQIIVQDIYTGERQVVSSEPGINGAPAWSPDGRRLALTLSRDGNPEIYILELASRRLQRLTNNSAIDTEPTWSPDGRHIVFTSDRGGSPQLYRKPVVGGRAERLTFEGNYNAAAAYSPDGERLALVHRQGSGFTIATLELATGQLRVLTEGSLDKSPSFAPNGRMIIHSSVQGQREVLATVAVDGRVRQRLALRDGQVREPAWSPFTD
jgi:TolB protein